LPDRTGYFFSPAGAAFFSAAGAAGFAVLSAAGFFSAFFDFFDFFSAFFSPSFFSPSGAAFFSAFGAAFFSAAGAAYFSAAGAAGFAALSAANATPTIESANATATNIENSFFISFPPEGDLKFLQSDCMDNANSPERRNLMINNTF